MRIKGFIRLYKFILLLLLKDFLVFTKKILSRLLDKYNEYVAERLDTSYSTLVTELFDEDLYFYTDGESIYLYSRDKEEVLMEINKSTLKKILKSVL